MLNQQIISTLSEDALFALTPQESKVLRLLFGIAIAEQSTEEVARLFDMTPEMVEEVKTAALRKLRQIH